MLLDNLYEPYQNCTLCPLSNNRTNVVFGRGNPDAKLLLIGEAPGKDEDLQATPFIGRSGKLLSQILDSLGIKEDEIYITNIVKCRPPSNRAPLPYEIATCTNILLEQQIAIIAPKVICALGASSAQTLSKEKTAISLLRTKNLFYNTIKLIATYHPAYILRNPKELDSLKRDILKAYSESMPN